MDTKELLDACRDAGVDVLNCDRDDVASVAMELLLSDAREYSEHWVDWIAEGIAENLQASQINFDCCLGRLQRDLKSCDFNLNSVRTVGSSDGLKAAQAAAIVQTNASIGAVFFDLIKSGAEKHIEENIDMWCQDVGSYAYDMREAQREDYEEGRYE